MESISGENSTGNQNRESFTTSVLVVEDDVSLAQLLHRSLTAKKHSVHLAHDAESALRAISQTEFDLLITDLNLPGMDGISLVKQVRTNMPRLPVLVLSARGTLEDRVATLDSGADDYLVKPFSMAELLARSRALVRRNGNNQKRVLEVADLILDRPQFRVERGGKKLDLTAKEFELLEYLMTNAHHAVTRPMIMENVWKTPYDGSTNLVDVYIKYVRDKVDTDCTLKLVRTIRGVGYVLTDN